MLSQTFSRSYEAIDDALISLLSGKERDAQTASSLLQEGCGDAEACAGSEIDDRQGYLNLKPIQNLIKEVLATCARNGIEAVLPIILAV